MYFVIENYYYYYYYYYIFIGSVTLDISAMVDRGAGYRGNIGRRKIWYNWHTVYALKFRVDKQVGGRKYFEIDILLK